MKTKTLMTSIIILVVQFCFGQVTFTDEYHVNVIDNTMFLYKTTDTETLEVQYIKLPNDDHQNKYSLIAGGNHYQDHKKRLSDLHFLIWKNDYTSDKETKEEIIKRKEKIEENCDKARSCITKFAKQREFTQYEKVAQYSNQELVEFLDAIKKEKTAKPLLLKMGWSEGNINAAYGIEYLEIWVSKDLEYHEIWGANIKVKELQECHVYYLYPDTKSKIAIKESGEYSIWLNNRNNTQITTFKKE